MSEILCWVLIEENERGKQRYRLDVRQTMSIVIGSLPVGADFTPRELAGYLDECIAFARTKQRVPSGILLYPAAGKHMQERVERELEKRDREQDMPLHDLIEQTEEAQVYRLRRVRGSETDC